MDETELIEFPPTFPLPILDKKYLVNNKVAKYKGYELPEDEKGDKTTAILLKFENNDGKFQQIPVIFYPSFYPSERINRQFNLVGGSRYKQKKTRSSRKNKTSSRKNKSKKFLKLITSSK